LVKPFERADAQLRWVEASSANDLSVGLAYNVGHMGHSGIQLGVLKELTLTGGLAVQ
jgi:hypothetical protein